MPKYKKGDKVKVRVDTTSPYRGRIGIINREPIKNSAEFSYTVKFESSRFTRSYLFAEHDLEAVNY